MAKIVLTVDTTVDPEVPGSKVSAYFGIKSERLAVLQKEGSEIFEKHHDRANGQVALHKVLEESAALCESPEELVLLMFGTGKVVGNLEAKASLGPLAALLGGK